MPKTPLFAGGQRIVVFKKIFKIHHPGAVMFNQFQGVFIIFIVRNLNFMIIICMGMDKNHIYVMFVLSDVFFFYKTDLV